MNRTLEEQVRLKKRAQEKRVTKMLTEPAPDYSRVHPEEAARNYVVEEQAKAALRAALDEQVEQRQRTRKKERQNQIRQDRFFIKGIGHAYVTASRVKVVRMCSLTVATTHCIARAQH